MARQGGLLKVVGKLDDLSFYKSADGFSICEESVPNGYPKDILETELIAATNILGFKHKNVHSLRYPVRKFNYHRQDILENIIKLRNSIKPDLVFIPSLNDRTKIIKRLLKKG